MDLFEFSKLKEQIYSALNKQSGFAGPEYIVSLERMRDIFSRISGGYNFSPLDSVILDTCLADITEGVKRAKKQIQAAQVASFISEAEVSDEKRG